MLYGLIRPLLFALDAEVSHDLTLNMLRLYSALKSGSPIEPLTIRPVDCFGLRFPNPIGLAAGLDKNAQCLSAWNSLGFGFIEVGTVTPKPQLGNAKPRLFRLPKNQALINRMGFNNKGIDSLIEQVKLYSHHAVLGINIGKNKDTTLEDAAKDYLICYQKAFAYADYVTVNISSPNTSGLRALQHGEMLKSILLPLKNEQKALADKFSKNVPILVKLAPDLKFNELKTIVDDLIQFEIDGVIVTNTTLQRHDLKQEKHVKEEGGLSGKPLFQPSTEVIRQIYSQVGDALPIVAVGGIFNSADAKAKFTAGAKLIQLYTGLIYRGPTLINEIADIL